MIGTADPHDMPFASIEMTAEQCMPLVPILLPTCVSALGPESSAHAELHLSQ